MHLKIFSIPALVLCLSSPLQAASSDDQGSLEEYRVLGSMSLGELLETDIASGTPLAQKFTPSVTSILTADEIRKSGARTLHEALEQVPGVHVYPSNEFVMKNGISIRGIQTVVNSQILILIDGVPLTSTNTSTPSVRFMMPTSLIHRIEVIRGPGSALYGADAFSGVVNVITKKSSNMNEEIGGRYGSFDTWESWLNTKAALGPVDVGLGLSLMQSSGDKKRILTTDSQSSRDALYGTSASLAPGELNTRYNNISGHVDVAFHDFDLNILAQKNNDAGTGDGVARSLDPDGYIDRTAFLIDLKNTNTTLFAHTTIKTGISASTNDMRVVYNVFPPGTMLGATTFSRGATYDIIANDDSYSAYLNTIYSGFEKHTLNMGVGYKYEQFSANQLANFGAGAVLGSMTELSQEYTYIPDSDRSSYYGLLQDEYSINRNLIFTAGFRFDYFNDFGSTVNPRLALVWQQSDDMTIKAMYGRAFRAPNFGDLYFNAPPLKVGNPDINPETIDTYEAAFNWRGPVHTKLNLFYYQAKDLIEYIAGSTAANARDQDGYGLELELEYPINEFFEIRGNYAYQHSEDSLTKDRIADAPMHQAFAQLQYHPTPNWNVNLQYYYIGKRYRPPSDPREDLNADSLVNLTVERKNIWHKLDVTVGARNLFDTDHREPSSAQLKEDYPMESLYLFGEIRYNF